MLFSFNKSKNELGSYIEKPNEFNQPGFSLVGLEFICKRAKPKRTDLRALFSCMKYSEFYGNVKHIFVDPRNMSEDYIFNPREFVFFLKKHYTFK